MANDGQHAHCDESSVLADVALLADPFGFAPGCGMKRSMQTASCSHPRRRLAEEFLRLELDKKQHITWFSALTTTSLIVTVAPNGTCGLWATTKFSLRVSRVA